MEETANWNEDGKEGKKGRYMKIQDGKSNGVRNERM